jgi:adenylate cyclase
MPQAKMKRSVIVILVILSLLHNGIIPVKASTDLPSDTIADYTAQVKSNLLTANDYLVARQEDSALFYASRALNLSEKKHNINLQCKSLISLYNIYRSIGEDQKSYECLNKCCMILNQVSDQEMVVDIFTGRALQYITQCLYDSSLFYLNKAASIASGTANRTRLPSIYENMGVAYQAKGEYLNAINNYLEFIKLSSETKDTIGLIHAYFDLAGIYSLAKRFHDATDNILMAKTLAQSIRNRSSEADAIKRLGEIAVETDRIQDAIYDFRLAIDTLGSSSDKRLEAYTFMELAEAYVKRGERAHSLAIYDTTYNLFREAGIIEGLGDVCLKRANIYLQSKDFTKAMECFNNSLMNYEASGDKWGMADAMAGIAKVYDSTGKNGKSVEYHFKALDIWKTINQKEKILQTYLLLTEDYKQKGLYKKALEYLEIALTMNGEISNLNINRAISEMQIRTEADQKDKEISLLSDYNALKQKQLEGQRQLKYFLLSIVILMILLSAGVINRNIYIRRTRNKLIDLNTDIIEEKAKSDKLLLNILPAETANELKKFGHAFAKKHELATVMFTDFKGFTQIAGMLDPADLIQEIGYCFRAFDKIISEHNLEKIKTMGDAYMAAGGLPVSNETHPVDAIEAAMQIRDFMNDFNEGQVKKKKPLFEVRIGINSGPVISGVVGSQKFAFDIWGDTVNLAYCAQTVSETGRINITRSTYDLVKDHFNFTPRGKINIKGDRNIEMFFVETKKQLAD